MIRNVAGQVAGGQLTTIATGAPFTGTVTVYVTGDGGTQAIGAVGAGICTNEGNGYFTYRPSQAETNYASVAFTFTGAGAVSETTTYETITTAQQSAMIATGTTPISDVLSDMLVIDNELDITAGGADESRAISAIGMAIRAFEAVIANVPDLLGNYSTVLTAANTETTSWPGALLRLDSLWLLDANGRQRWEVDSIQDIGAQTPNARWPFGASSVASGNGAPIGYYANRAEFFWRPIPDAVYTLRTYGLYAKIRPAVRTDLFPYPDLVSVPCAAYAVRLMEMGINDTSDELKALAEEIFNPAINALKRPIRQRPQSRVYSRVHTT
jgi:hypothetical protein